MTSKERSMLRNILAFWIFGMCNNYGYVIMLSAAEDIIHKKNHDIGDLSTNVTCIPEITSRACHGRASTGAVLLADILPSLVVKAVIPFFMHRIPYGFRHFIVVGLQLASYLVVAYATSFEMAILGVGLASFGSGIGETTYLSLSSHFPPSTIAAWSSGTGGAGVIGSFSYAFLTEPHLGGLSPKNALLVMLIIPVAFAVAYWIVLRFPTTVYSPKCSPNSWIVPAGYDGTSEKKNGAKDPITGEPLLETTEKVHRVPQRVLSFSEKISLIKPLLKLMIPLIFVYYGEYLINQGLTQLIYFDCKRGFNLTKSSQYRWYQVLYQVGVFISRSSVKFLELPLGVLYLLPILQMGNAVFFYFEARYAFLPHIWIAFALILIEGLYGGSSYVNTFNWVHKNIAPDVKEYSLSITSMSDSFGIVCAAFSGIVVHNFICDQLT
ncbi:unnamed protein product, partial [Mesorhabditis belari]|uniref:Battenin n=1 Tax=Mesorhabditis belari TaxID=2138241 RepID=A0AAF3FKF2_9BILA